MLKSDGPTNLNLRARSLYSGMDISTRQYVTWKLRIDPIFRGIDQVVPPSGRITDAGCGFGLMSNLLALRSSERQIVGADLDQRRIHIAICSARTLTNVRFVCADLLSWDFPPSDCVLLIDVLHYWSADKQERIIAKAAAALAPGGTLVLREGLRSRSWGHRLVAWAERGAMFIGNRRRGDGLCFQDRGFYVDASARHGLHLSSESADLGLGSNTVLIMHKAQV